MNAQIGGSKSTPRAPNPPRTHMSSQNQGGRPMTIVVGMATVAAGLGAFWMLQFRMQNRNPPEISTWQYRHAQQAAEANEQVGTSGSGTKTTPTPREPQVIREIPAADDPGAVTAERRGNSESASLSAGEDRSILASFLTFIRGDPKDRSSDGYVGQPTPIGRPNDRDGVYTKNLEYKNSFRRD